MKPIIHSRSSIKQLTIFACLIVLLSTMFTACIIDNATLPKTSPSVDSRPREIVTVEQLLQNPKNYPGFLCVEGIVSEVSVEQKMFTIIDNQEFLLCGTTGCALLTLSVQWLGTMPRIEDTVQVSGEIHSEDRKLVLIGQELDIIQRK